MWVTRERPEVLRAFSGRLTARRRLGQCDLAPRCSARFMAGLRNPIWMTEARLREVQLVDRGDFAVLDGDPVLRLGAAVIVG